MPAGFSAEIVDDSLSSCTYTNHIGKSTTKIALSTTNSSAPRRGCLNQFQAKRTGLAIQINRFDKPVTRHAE